MKGFFDICRLVGLTSDQGVLVLHQNVKNLMLRDDVLEEVETGMFHIYQIKTIEEGIEILTGVPEGERRPDGSYAEGTVNQMVDSRLEELGQSLCGFYAEMLGETVA